MKHTAPALGSCSQEEFCRRWKIAGLRMFGSALRVPMQEQLSGIVGRGVDLASQRAIERNSKWIRRKAILESAEPHFASR